MKKILLMLALSTMVFATSCKKEPQPIINNVTACDMSDMDSTFIMIKQLDVDTMHYFENGVFVGSNTNLYLTHFDPTSYALVKCEGVILDTIHLMFYPSANYEQAIYLNSPYYMPNFMLCYWDGKMVKYNRFKETTLEVYDNSGNQLGNCRFDGRGFYGTPNTVGEGGNTEIIVKITEDAFALGLML